MKQSMPAFYARTAAKNAQKAYLKDKMTKEERARHACDNAMAVYSIAFFAAAGEALGYDKVDKLQDTADDVDRELISKAYPQTTKRLKEARAWIVGESKPLMHHTPIHLPTSGRNLNAAERWILGEMEAVVTNSARVFTVALNRAFGCEKEVIARVLDATEEKYRVYLEQAADGRTKEIRNDLKQECGSGGEEICKEMTLNPGIFGSIIW